MKKARFYHHWTYLGLWLMHYHREGVRMPSFQKGYTDGSCGIRNYIWFVPPKNVKIWRIGNKLGYKVRQFRIWKFETLHPEGPHAYYEKKRLRQQKRLTQALT
jgi:hypothetical protein